MAKVTQEENSVIKTENWVLFLPSSQRAHALNWSLEPESFPQKKLPILWFEMEANIQMVLKLLRLTISESGVTLHSQEQISVDWPLPHVTWIDSVALVPREQEVELGAGCRSCLHKGPPFPRPILSRSRHPFQSMRITEVPNLPQSFSQYTVVMNLLNQ